MKLEPGNPQNLTDRNRAIRMAELLVLAAEGVIVLEQEADAEAATARSQKLVLRRGRVPDELIEQLAT